MAVNVGGVIVGGGAPIVVQSMTNTDTADVDRASAGGAGRHHAHHRRPRHSRGSGAEDQGAMAQFGVAVRIVADFTDIGHTLLTDHPACAEALDKYRINPGNVGFKNKRDPQFTQIVDMAIKYAQAGAHRRQLRARSTRNCSRG